MKILIHACPQRMWYVEEFLIPALEAQGADAIEVWNDTEGLGNLESCLRSFEAREGSGGTWHIQDDVLPCRDFIARCRELDEGVVFGFCCREFTDNPAAAGLVYAEDAWHSFQCVRIPDAYARECAAWVRSDAWQTESPSVELPMLHRLNKGDDTFFHEFLLCRHGTDDVVNVKPCLVEHVDWLIGGSTLGHWRQYVARADFWYDEDLTAALRRRLRERKANQTPEGA